MSKSLKMTQRGFVLSAKPAKRSPGEQKIYDRLALIVGYVAFGLPIVMMIGGMIGTTNGNGCFRDSISHFYHAQLLGGFFVGMLFFIGGFLFAYSGSHWLETWGSTVAGICAIAVALFPIAESGCESRDIYLSRVFVEVTNTGTPPYTVAEATEMGQNFFNLFGAASNYHMAGAGAVFVYLGLFCLIALRRVMPSIHGQGEEMKVSKRKRNTLYFWCGVIILACVAVLALKGKLLGDLTGWNAWNLTFWVEMVALFAFGTAWLAKGRLFKRLND